MSAPVTERERRKKNFSPKEKAIVINAISRYDESLHGAQSATTTKVRKEEILQEITMQVNARGQKRRCSKYGMTL